MPVLSRWLGVASAVIALVACFDAHASVQWTGGCSYAISGGASDPHAPVPDGICRSPPSSLSGIAGSFTSLGSASAGYELRPLHGDLAFTLSAVAGALPPADATASSGARLEFDDVVELTSATLPIGTGVAITFSGTVRTFGPDLPAGSATVDNAVEAFFSLTGAGLSEALTLCGGRAFGACDVTLEADVGSFSKTVLARVGDRLNLRGSVMGFLSIDANPPGGGRAVFEVSDRTFLTSLTDAVSLVAQSGTDYAAPIPEPMTAVLMVTGLALLARRARPTKRVRASAH